MRSREEIEREFSDAYDRLADMLFRHCFFYVRSRERAQELMQESFVRAFEYAAKGGSIKNLRAFLYRIAKNLAFDDLRKRKEWSLDALKEKGFDPKDSDPALQPVSAAEAGEMLAILDRLDEKCRALLVMRHVNDLPVQEIAEILKESANVISVRLHRCVKKLREVFGEQFTY